MTIMMHQLMAPVAGLLGVSVLATAAAAVVTTQALGGQSGLYVFPAFALLFCASIGMFTRVHRRFQVLDRRIDQAEGRIAEQSAALARGEERARFSANFLAELSHELRTPLSAVLGFSETMQNQHFGPIGSKRYRDYAGYINTSTRHMLELLNDVLDLSRAESGRLKLHEGPIDVGATIRSTLQIVSHEAERAGVRLSASASRLAPILADEWRLRQMLLNLLSNAIKFTPAGGHVEIRSRTERGGCLTIAVRDTGMGITSADVTRILMPFGKIGEPNGHHALQGTGIGLSLTRRLIERHGASLALDSAPGEGTTVTLRFPATRLLLQDMPRENSAPQLRLIRAV